jgi:tetratricopeptide (TPR) repeat protein
MAYQPSERYATALALAADVEHWLADEPVSAYAEGWATRLRRWSRRHRPLVASLAAAALVAVLLGGWGWWYLEQQEAERREEVARLEGRDQQAIQTALEQAEQFLRQARWPDAEAALAQAEGRLAGGGADDLKQQLRQARDDLRLVKRLDEIRLDAATIVNGKWNPPKAGPDYAVAFKEHGLDVLAGEEAEWGQRIAASPVKEQLLAGLDHWVTVAMDAKTVSRLMALARQADPDALRNRFRDPEVLRDRQKLTQLAQKADIKRLSPALLAVVVLRLERMGGPGVELLERGQRCYPADFWINFQLAAALNKRGRWDEAVGYHRAALAARPRTAAVYNDMGLDLFGKRDLDGAIAAYKQALDLDPKFANAHCNLGLALATKGDLDEALAHFKKAVARDPKGAIANHNLRVALAIKAGLDGALTEYKKVPALDPKFAKGHNNYSLALAHCAFGLSLEAKKDLDGAIAAYQKALALDPKLGFAHYGLGVTLKAKGDLDAAIAALRKAIAIGPRFVPAHIHLGLALAAKKDLDGAIAAYKQAIALDPKDARAHNHLGAILCAGKHDFAGGIAEFKKAIALDPSNAGSNHILGNALKAKGDLDGAIAAYKQALALDPKYAKAHTDLGLALAAKKDLDGAIAAYKKAISLDPKDVKAHYNQGIALIGKGDLDGAIAEYKQAIALNSKNVEAHFHLGNALKAKQDLAGAIAAYKKAIAIDPKFVPAHHNLGQALRAKGDLAGAIAAYKKAIAIDPKLARAHGALGQALLAQGRFAEARTATRKCRQLLDPADPLRNVATQQLRQCEQWLQLDAKLPALLKPGAPPPDTTELLALAMLCQNYKKRYTAAARFYADAFAANAKLADDLARQHRYNAACAATLAAAGKGEDAAMLKDKKRTRLRKQALDWLQDDLAAWTKVAANWTKMAAKKSAPAKAAVRQTMEHWQKDSDLAGVRDKAALAKLPKDEREAWGKLWADVEALLKKVKATK